MCACMRGEAAICTHFPPPYSSAWSLFAREGEGKILRRNHSEEEEEDKKEKGETAQ